MLSWYLHMFSAVAFILYLLFHLFLLFALSRGELFFAAVAARCSSLPFLCVEMLCLAGCLFHGINGLRYLCLDAGIWFYDQAIMAKTVFFIVLILLLYHSLPMIEQFFGVLF